MHNSTEKNFTYTVSHTTCPTSLSNTNQYVWHYTSPKPFNELIISWNAPRPQHDNANLNIDVRIKKGDTWSPWIPYMHWGSNTQYSYPKKTFGFVVRNINVIAIPHGHAHEIEVLVHTPSAPLRLDALHICRSDLQKFPEHPEEFNA